ncbi:UNVERIFIED_CONTAM: hypothetical protein RMT77_002426 [Armadillidium vulgare]
MPPKKRRGVRRKKKEDTEENQDSFEAEDIPPSSSNLVKSNIDKEEKDAKSSVRRSSRRIQNTLSDDLSQMESSPSSSSPTIRRSRRSLKLLNDSAEISQEKLAPEESVEIDEENESTVNIKNAIDDTETLGEEDNLEKIEYMEVDDKTHIVDNIETNVIEEIEEFSEMKTKKNKECRVKLVSIEDTIKETEVEKPSSSKVSKMDVQKSKLEVQIISESLDLKDEECFLTSDCASNNEVKNSNEKMETSSESVKVSKSIITSEVKSESDLVDEEADKSDSLPKSSEISQKVKTNIDDCLPISKTGLVHLSKEGSSVETETTKNQKEKNENGEVMSKITIVEMKQSKTPTVELNPIEIHIDENERLALLCTTEADKIAKSATSKTVDNNKSLASKKQVDNNEKLTATSKIEADKKKSVLPSKPQANKNDIKETSAPPSKTETGSDSQKNKIPGRNFIIGTRGVAEDGKKTLFDCVLCFSGEEKYGVPGLILNKHIKTKEHALKVMEVENQSLYKRFKDNPSAKSEDVINAILFIKKSGL